MRDKILLKKAVDRVEKSELVENMKRICAFAKSRWLYAKLCKSVRSQNCFSARQNGQLYLFCRPGF